MTGEIYDRNKRSSYLFYLHYLRQIEFEFNRATDDLPATDENRNYLSVKNAKETNCLSKYQ